MSSFYKHYQFCLAALILLLVVEVSASAIEPGCYRNKHFVVDYNEEREVEVEDLVLVETDQDNSLHITFQFISNNQHICSSPKLKTQKIESGYKISYSYLDWHPECVLIVTETKNEITFLDQGNFCLKQFECGVRSSITDVRFSLKEKVDLSNCTKLAS